MNDTDYRNALERIAERGSVRGADAVLTAAVDDEHPVPAPLTPRPLRARAVVVIAAAAAVLALLVVARGGIDRGGITTGTEPTVPGVSPHLVTTGLPPTFAPDELTADPDVTPAPGGNRETGTMQRFRGRDGGGRDVDLTIFATAFSGSMSPTPERVRGVAGFVQPSAAQTLGWLPPDARVLASSYSLSGDQLRALVEALGARGPDALTGFDAPAGPVGGIRLALVAEHIAARGDPPPGHGSITYRDTTEAQRVVTVESYGPVTGADLDLVTMWPQGQPQVIAGAERIVNVTSPTDPPPKRQTTVSWILPDGSQAVVRARGLSDDEVAAAVRGVGTVDDAGWAGLDAAVRDRRGTHGAVLEADLAPGHLRVPRISRPSPDTADSCLDVTGLGALCPGIPPGGQDGGAVVFGPSGRLRDGQVEDSTRVYSMVKADRWFLFGYQRGPASITLARDGNPIALPSAVRDGTTLLAVELPPGVDHVDLRSPSGGTVDMTRPTEGTTSGYGSY